MPKLSEIITAFTDALTNAPKEHKKTVAKNVINEATRATGVDKTHTPQEQTAAKYQNALARLAATNESVAKTANIPEGEVKLAQGQEAINPNARTAPNTSASPDLKKTPPTNTPTFKPM
jgi:hypothetical protein